MKHSGEDTRQRLLESAGEVFAEKGLQAATVREICGRAGANVAAVNYYFSDKERLYIEVVRHALGSGEDEPPPGWPPGTPPAVKLREFIRRMLARMLDVNRPAWHAQLMMREITEPTAACVELVKADIGPRAEMLQSIVDELVPPETPAADRHLIALSIVGQCHFFHVPNPIVPLVVGEDEYRTYDVARLSDHIARFSLAALGHDRPVQATIPTAGKSP